MTQLSLFDNDGQPLEPFRDIEERVRKAQHNGQTHYSLVDICGVIAGTKWARDYWVETKTRLKKDGFQLSENLLQLKLKAPDGKMRATDCATAETCLRIVQSIPSPNAEPIRQWLARVGYERLEEMANPELGLTRADARYLEAQRARGLSETDAQEQLANRRNGKVDFQALMNAVQRVCVDTPRYGALVNTEYEQLFGTIASELKVMLNSDSIRDALPALQYSYVRTAELNMRQLLQNADRMTFDQIQRAMVRIAQPLGEHLAEMCELFGIDRVTGQPLLQGGAV